MTLWFIPPLFIAGIIWRYAVDMPVWDDIIISDTVHRLITNGFLVQELFAQHNEARPAVLTPYFSAALCRYAMGCSISDGGFLPGRSLTSAVMIYICRTTIQSSSTAMVAALLINFMLFSPVQWQCFLWGMELIVFISTLPLVVAIACLASPMAIYISMPIAVAAAVTANFSSSNGMLIWLLAIPFFLLHRSQYRLKALVGWLVVAAICMGFYFYGYQRPSNIPAVPWWHMIVHEPKFVFSFPVAFLGNGVRIAFDYWTDFFVAAPALVVWGAGVLYLLLFCRNVEVWRK